MYKKIFLLGLALFALFGILLSILFFPSKAQVAFVYMKSYQYSASLKVYQKLYDEGARGLDVLIPLIDLDLMAGDTKKAVRLTEELVVNYPNLPGAKEKLVQVYKYDGRPADAMRLLNELNEEKPTKEKTLELLLYYRGIDNQLGEERELKHLIKFGAEDFTYERLAFLEASQNNLEGAVEVLEKNPITFYSEEGADLFIKLLLKTDKTDEAFQKATNYLAWNPKPEIAVNFGDLFFNRGFYQMAYDLVLPFREKGKENPDILAAYVNFARKVGLGEEGYQFIKGVYNQGDLPSVLYEYLVSLALDENDTPLLERFAQNEPINFLSPEVLVQLLIYGRDNSQIILNALAERISQEKKDESHFLAVAMYVVLSKNGNLSQESLAAFIKTYPLSSREEIQLVQILVDGGYIEEARDVFNLILSLKDMISSEILDYGVMGARFKEPAKALLLVSNSYDSLDKFQQIGANLASMILNTALGNTREVIKGLEENGDDLSPLFLEKLFYIAKIEKQTEVEFLAANLWVKKDPSDSSLLAYTEALLNKGDFKEAYRIAESLLAKNPKGVSAREAYILALSKLAKEDPSYRKRLNHYLTQALEDQTIAYETKLSWGYLFLDEKLKKEAETLFEILSQGKLFDDNSVQALLWLYGEKPSKQDLKWMVDRARKTLREEKVKWVEYLVGLGQEELIFDIITPKDLEDVKLFKVYIEAYVNLKAKWCVKEFICSWFDKIEDVERLNILAQAATDLTLFEESYLLFKKAISVDPENSKALFGFAFNAYLISAFEESFCVFKKLHEREIEDYRIPFYMGSILWEWKCWNHAIGYFNEAQSLIAEKSCDKIEAWQVSAEIALHESLYFEALEILQQLQANHPENIDLVNTLADAYIDIGFYCSAEKLLNAYLPYFKVDEDLFGMLEAKTWLSLYLLKVKLYRWTGRIAWADSLLYDLACFGSDEDFYWKEVAAFDAQVGRWRMTLRDFCFAMQANPYNESVIEQIADVREPKRSYFSFNPVYQYTGNIQTEHIYSFDYRYRVCEPFSLGAQLQFDHMTATDVQNVYTGETYNFKGTKYRGYLGAWYEALNGDEFHLAYLFADGISGGRIYYLKNDLRGFTKLGLDLNYPSWELSETIAERGRFSYLYLERSFVWTPYLTLDVLGGYRFWSVSTLNNVANSLPISLSWTYTIINPFIKAYLGKDGYLNLIYLFGAEYVMYAKTATNVQGDQYQVLPLGNAEIHTLLMTARKQYSPRVFAEGFFGWSFDRFGGAQSPVFGLYILRDCPHTYTLRLGATYELSGNPQGIQRRLFLDLRIPFN